MVRCACQAERRRAGREDMGDGDVGKRCGEGGEESAEVGAWGRGLAGRKEGGRDGRT